MCIMNPDIIMVTVQNYRRIGLIQVVSFYWMVAIVKLQGGDSDANRRECMQ